jgi:hypothetical protein
LMAEASDRCLWCGSRFERRNDGGKAQRFCRPACRYALDAAGRRWIAGALASGDLTSDMLRNGSPGEAEELLGDLLVVLLEWPDHEWFALIDKLPGELVERLCDWVEAAPGH